MMITIALLAGFFGFLAGVGFVTWLIEDDFAEHVKLPNNPKSRGI